MGLDLRHQRDRRLHHRRRSVSRGLERTGATVSLVLTTSANAVVAKKGSLAYDTSKAAANHLVRELAVELSPLVRVNGVAPRLS
jgi:NAD(P)-dependent dehydrogenase (short-subunit alcohol dehydrogenase family)